MPIRPNTPIYQIHVPVQTIEKTAKVLKLQIILSSLAMVAGILVAIVRMAVDNSAPGWIIFLFGACWYILTRLRIWWHHG